MACFIWSLNTGLTVFALSFIPGVTEGEGHLEVMAAHKHVSVHPDLHDRRRLHRPTDTQ